MNQLYPLKFKPIIKDKIWGGTRLKTVLNKDLKSKKAGESWEISGFSGNVSKVKNGFLAGNNLQELIEIYMGDLVGERVFEKFGTLFPLLIKYIDANDTLSIQVHPGDELALKQFASYGKTEMWYIIEAENGAEIITGFNQPVNKEIFQQHLVRKTLPAILNKEKAVPGDVFFLPSGRVHAIGQGILLAEIQQTSDATLRIYDYDRVDDKGKPRQLHTEKALEAIDFKTYSSFKTIYPKTSNQPNQLVECEYFTANHLILDNTIERDYIDIDSFVVYICIEGSFSLIYDKDKTERIVKGETILLPAEIKNVQLVPVNSAKIIEVYIKGSPANNRLDSLLERVF